MTDLEKCAPSLLPTLFRPEAHSTLTVPIRPKSWIGSFVSSSSLAAETTALPCGDNRSRAWFTVLGAFICLFGTFGQMNAFGSFQSWYTHHQLQHLSPSTISWIGSLQLWVFFFSGGAIGRAFDAYGPYCIMMIGTGLSVAGLLLTSIATRYYQYMLSQGLLFGLGVGMMFYPLLASIATNFKEKSATALGLAAAGSSVGGFMWPLILERLFSKIGFSWTVRVAALITLVCCLVALATVRRGAPSSSKCSASWLDLNVLYDLRFLLLALGSALVSFGLYVPFFYLVDYSIAHSISPKTSVYILSTLNAFGILGRILPAYLSDILGHFNVLFPSAFFLGLSCLTLWLFATSPVTIFVFAAFYGFWSGAFVSIVTSCAAKLSEVGERGTRIGMLFSIVSVPSLLGGPLAGFLLSHSHSHYPTWGPYTPMIALAGTSAVVGSLFILWSKLLVDRRLLARV